MSNIKLNPRLAENVYPGCGYFYAGHSPSKTPAVIPLEPSKAEVSSIPKILFSIKSQPKLDESVLSNLSDDSPVPSVFKLTNSETSTDIFSSSSVSEIYESIELNGPSKLNLVTDPKHQPLSNLVLEEQSINLFAKFKTQILSWKLNDAKIKIINGKKLHSEEFETKHGDCYVKELIFGRESLFQLMFNKELLEQIGFDFKNADKIASELKNFLENKNISENGNQKKLLDLEKQRGITIISLKINKLNEEKQWSLQKLKKFAQAHHDLAKVHPTVLNAKASFYPNNLYEGEMDLEAKLRKVSEFEDRTVPNIVDLFQTKHFLTQIKSSPELYSPAEMARGSLLLETISGHLAEVKTHFALLKNRKLFLRQNFPRPPLASELLSPILNESPSDSKTAAKEGILNNEQVTLNLRESHTKIPSTAFKSQEEMVEIDFKNKVALCSQLEEFTEDYKGVLHSTNIPRYFVDISETAPVLNTSVSHYIKEYPFLSPGRLALKSPQNFKEWYKLMKGIFDKNSTKQVFLSVFEIAQKNYTALPVYTPGQTLNRTVTDLGPRAISCFPDGKRFVFHPSTKKSFLDYLEIFNVVGFDNKDVLQMLLEGENGYIENKKLLGKVSDSLRALIKKLPGEDFDLPAQVLKNAGARKELFHEIDFYISKDNKLTKPILVKMRKALEDYEGIENGLIPVGINTAINSLSQLEDDEIGSVMPKLNLKLNGYSNDCGEEVEISYIRTFQCRKIESDFV